MFVVQSQSGRGLFPDPPRVDNDDDADRMHGFVDDDCTLAWQGLLVGRLGKSSRHFNYLY